MISQALDRCLRWHLTYPCSRCPLRYLERERTEGRKREKFYICLDVTHTHPTHTPHTHTMRQIRGKTTETQRRYHHAQHVPHKGTIDGTKCHACHAKTHLASQPRARVISEETRPRHIRGKFPRHNRGALPGWWLTYPSEKY